MIEINDLFVSYGKNSVLRGAKLSCKEGQITTLVGKNGAGKSTLLKSLVGILPVTCGDVKIDGSSILAMSYAERARHIAYLPQDTEIPDISVGRLVLNGRYPHLSYPRRYSENDKKIAEQTMKTMGIYEISERPVMTLSGGMRQKAYIAMALCQQTNVIVMDEPISHLDISQQFVFFDIVKELSKSGKTILMVLHDLQFALRISDNIVFLEEGKVIFEGTPSEFIKSGIPESMYGISINFLNNGFSYYRI